MISDIYGDYYRFRKDWKLVGVTDWIKVIIAVILAGVGIGLIIAPFLMVLLNSWTVAFALSVATINALFGLVLAGTGKWIFDSTNDRNTLSFLFYTGILASMTLFLLLAAGFYSRLAYIIAAG